MTAQRMVNKSARIQLEADPYSGLHGYRLRDRVRCVRERMTCAQQVIDVTVARLSRICETQGPYKRRGGAILLFFTGACAFTFYGPDERTNRSQRHRRDNKLD